MSQPPAESFPRRYARTHRFRLGEPRSLTVTDDGARVLFLRSPAGDDPVNSLWSFDTGSRREQLIVDARDLGAGVDAELSPDERARRERARETAGGIVDYAVDRPGRIAAFALDGGLFVADLVNGGGRALPAAIPAFDPRPAPGGERVSYVCQGALRMVDLETGEDREVSSDPDDAVSWGVAEFVASEEMDRYRGHWWSPEGQALLAARVDESSVRRWHIASPEDPEREPVVVRYPVAGTANAIVTLHLLDLDGGRVDVAWDRAAFEYVVAVTWPRDGQPTVLVQSRDQRRWQILQVDPATGRTDIAHRDASDRWLEILRGVPAFTDDGRLVFVTESDDTRRLTLDGLPVTPPGLQVRRVEHVGGDVLFTGSETDPEEVHLYRLDAGGTVTRLTEEPGVHGGTGGGDVTVRTAESMDWPGARTAVWRGDEPIGEIASNAEPPVIEPDVTLLRAGPRGLSAALLRPSGWDGRGRLPVLLSPYGGPQFQQVMRSRRHYLLAQWLADQGFAVLVIDGRGTPGRGLAWEHAVWRDFGVTLEDQVDGLHAVAAEHPELDLGRVGIRGWSFGGTLAAMAVLRRPDVFHAAVAGAAGTDERLYDTHYTERYLGNPNEEPEVYDRNSVVSYAAGLERPLLLVHGMADDNVVVANTLRLSRALLQAGRPHQVLPLSGITHMTNEPATAENLLRLEVEFLRQALGVPPPGPVRREVRPPAGPGRR
ncbi:MAG TPA: prolyl oligopeptidase family serine peptidase [Actinomycetota bacterium]|nr:prolyl oligopeptidase family serine peptidase [Actinomycetota bacterium]